jgi:hypothetical protein
MSNNPPHKVPGFVAGDKRKGVETRTPEEIERDERKARSPLGGLLTGLSKLIGGR